MYKIINRIPFAKKSDFFLDQLEDTSILIKTLERKNQLIHLLNSIQYYRFKGPVIIADDSKLSYKDDILPLFPRLNIQYIVLPHDTGTAEGRNAMLRETKTTFFVLCDDDFIFEPRTRIPLMRQLMIEHNLDILAGVFIQHNLKSRKARLKERCMHFLLKFNFLYPPSQLFEYFASFEIEGSVCKMRKVQYEHPVTICDLAHNFFIARTERVNEFGGWNPLLKGGEHQNFFIRAKLKGLKVATTRLCGVIHNRWTKNSEEYQMLRNRSPHYKKNALQEFGINKMENYKLVLGEDFNV